MKISTKLLFIVTFSSLVVASLSVYLYFSVQSYNLALEKNKVADKIANNLFIKSSLLNEYLLHYNDRPRDLWVNKNDELVGYLKLHLSQFTSAVDQQQFRDLLNKMGDVQQSFLRLVANQHNIEQDNTTAAAIAKEKQARLVTQILINNQENVSAAERLTNGSLKDAESARKMITYLSVIFFVVLVFTVVAILYFSWFSVLKPILDFKRVALRTASLDFAVSDHAAPPAFKISADEIGQLGEAFNNMVGKLQESYKQLHKSNQELTAAGKALKEKMSEMEQFNKMMVGRELKMVELKKEIASLKNKKIVS